MDFHHFSDTFSPFFTSSPWPITSQRAKQQHILFFSKGQRMKKDVDINVTRVLWYIFNVWEKIETQGENKQACMDHCVWRTWYLQIHLSKSCKCFHVFFYDNDGEWVMSWANITVRGKWLHNASDVMVYEGNVVCQRGRGKRRCPWVVRAKRSTAVHLTEYCKQNLSNVFYLSPMETRWKNVEKLTTNVSCMLSKTFRTADLVTLNKVYKLWLVEVLD